MLRIYDPETCERAPNLFCEIVGRSIFDMVKKSESYLYTIESAFVILQFERWVD